MRVFQPSHPWLYWAVSCSEFGEENTLVAQDSSQNMLFRSYVIFYSETKDQLKDWAKQWALLWSATTSSQFCWKIHLTQKMEWLVAARNLQSIKTFWHLNWVSISRVVACFPQVPVAAHSDCCRLWNTLCLCLPVLPAQAVPERCSQSLPVDFALQTFDYLLEQPLGRLPNLDSASWPMGCKGFIASKITA